MYHATWFRRAAEDKAKRNPTWTYLSSSGERPLQSFFPIIVLLEKVDTEKGTCFEYFSPEASLSPWDRWGTRQTLVCRLWDGGWFAFLFDPCSLYLHTFHLIAKWGVASNESRVLIPTVPSATGKTLEAPQIQLSLERVVLDLIEKSGHYSLYKGILVVNLECIVARKPRHDCLKAFRISCVEQFMEFPWKW